MQIDSENVADAVAYVQNLRMYQPFKYSGRWFCAIVRDDTPQCYIYRTKKAATGKLKQAGDVLYEFNI